jgi:hypothetical protein
MVSMQKKLFYVLFLGLRFFWIHPKLAHVFNVNMQENIPFLCKLWNEIQK